MIEFPSDLPCASVEYSLRVRHNIRRTTLQSGRIRQRRTSRGTHRTANVKWVMNDGQFLLFETWLDSMLNGGAEWFLMKLKSGGGIELHECRLIEGAYQAEYIAPGYFSVIATLDICPTIRPPSDISLMFDYFGNDIFDLAINKEWAE